jgi:hypothetical protein
MRLLLSTALLVLPISDAPRSATAQPKTPPNPVFVQVVPARNGKSPKVHWANAKTLVADYSATVEEPDMGNGHLLITATFGSAFATPLTQTLALPQEPMPVAASVADSVLNRLHIATAKVTLLPLPSRNRALIIAEPERPAAVPRVGGADGQTLAHPMQAWLTDYPVSNAAQPVFQSNYDLAYAWSPRGNFVIANSRCYGDFLGAGLYAVSLMPTRVMTIATSYSGQCEGGVGYQVSPDEKYITFDGSREADVGMWVSRIDGTSAFRLCERREYARSAAWSATGAFLYAACASTAVASVNAPDVLRRYDLRRNQQRALTNPSTFVFRAAQMALSPDGRKLAIDWRESAYYPGAANGIWVIDLTRLSL